MLTADQITALRDRSEQLLDPVIDFLIEDIVRRITEAGQLTGTASYQTWKLQNLGMSQRQLKKEIAKRLEISLADAEKLLTQAAETDYSFDISRFPNTQAIPLSANSSLQQILEATVAQAREDLTNMTQTMGFVGADGICRPLTQAYQQACDFAFQKISTGAQDYVSAIRDATWGLAEKGIRTIDYNSGYHLSIEAAVRQNMMGGMGIMQNHIAQNNHDTLGCNGWEISAHENSAPDHEPIQGKQYSDEEYQALNNRLRRRIGTLHCGHYASPIILGIHSPQFTDEELEDMRRRNAEGVAFEGRHYTGYEATQQQRKFERNIRKQQRRILIDETAEDTEKLQTDQIRLQRLKQEYKRFSEGVDLPMQYERLDTAGFTWKHAKAAESTKKAADRAEQAEKLRKAEEAAKKAKVLDDAHKAWLQSIGAEGTSLDSVDKLREARYNNTEEYQLLKGYSKAVEKGDISPLVGFALYQETNDAIKLALVGQTTSTGVEICSFATHFIDRIIGQSSDAHENMRQGVPIESVLDAIKNPVKIGEPKTMSDGDVRQTFYGNRAMVTLSIRDRRLIQTNPQKGKKKK